MSSMIPKLKRLTALVKQKAGVSGEIKLSDIPGLLRGMQGCITIPPQMCSASLVCVIPDGVTKIRRYALDNSPHTVDNDYTLSFFKTSLAEVLIPDSCREIFEFEGAPPTDTRHVHIELAGWSPWPLYVGFEGAYPSAYYENWEKNRVAPRHRGSGIYRVNEHSAAPYSSMYADYY